MTRMIERWFPCAEVSDASAGGWGSGNAERNLFTWFAARPVAQAKAAVITSLLPWPEEPSEQARLQSLVREAMTGRFAAWTALRQEIIKANGDDASVLDPFSGRGMIPLEAARLALKSYGVDYSPVAVVASELLTSAPFENWGSEPELPYSHASGDQIPGTESRLLSDVQTLLDEVGRRVREDLADLYPKVDERQPWGYLWAVTLPCQECGRRFPLVGSLALRKSSYRRRRDGTERFDPGQSFTIVTDDPAGTFSAEVHEGSPEAQATLVNAVAPGGKKIKGKSAVCPFCEHVHPLATHQRLAGQGVGEDALLVVSDIDAEVGRSYRTPTGAELDAVVQAKSRLAKEQPFGTMPAVPDEEIPADNGATIRPQLYGARTYGDLMCDRQTLNFIVLARTINEVSAELLSAGLSLRYVTVLAEYITAQLVRKLRRSTRGATLDVGRAGVHDIFQNESTISFSYDYFEPGIGEGAGTWASLSGSGMSTLRGLVENIRGVPTRVERGSATSLPFRDGSMTAVVTDPPYDAMVYYSDCSDLSFAWMKRALLTVRPDFGITADMRGLQEKTYEIIVKDHGRTPGEHRDRDHYDTSITVAFAEMRRVVRPDGLVTIVFGHGEPEVWKRLLAAIAQADLVMTGSWPARTEAGGQQGKANIETTLTMCCRPAVHGRPKGRRAAVEAAVRREVKERIPLWTRSGLAPTDMLMASAGPAMEVVGRYSQVLDPRGEPVDLDVFLPIARQAVQEAEAIEIDHHPLETFDARTRFALWWVRLFGRSLAAKSELRWQVLASSMNLAEVRDLVPDASKGCRFVDAQKFTRHITPESSVVDVALRMAKAWPGGLDAVGQVMADAGRDAEDAYLWAAIAFLADRLPNSDTDAIAWTGILRNRRNVGAAARGTVVASDRAKRDAAARDAQQTLDFVDADFGFPIEPTVEHKVEHPRPRQEGDDA